MTKGTPDPLILRTKEALRVAHEGRSARIAENLANIPVASRLTYKKATNGTASPRMAIKAMCMECIGWMRVEVRDCTAVCCPLYLYRPYQKKE